MFSEGGSCKKLTFIVSGEMDTLAATEFGKEYRETKSETLGITKLTLDLTGLSVKCL
ncbi:MAG: hypothetical protein IJT16_14980 [Lachnospiraceae bacterium]|nr:hypothetical protein [Lachnospiraceae bacterium]